VRSSVTRKTWLRIPLDPPGDSFTGRFRVLTLDQSGTASAPTEGEIRGTRMVAEAFASALRRAGKWVP
jgi:hypothetical protein